MSIQSSSVLSASPALGNLNLLPVADVLPDEFAQLDFDYIQDTLVELLYDPEFGQPYRVRIGLETLEACDTLAEAELAFADAKSDLLEAAALGRGPAVSPTTRKHAKGTLYRGALIQLSPEAGGYGWMFRRGRFDS